MDLAHFWFQGADGPTPPFHLGSSLRFRGAQRLARAFTVSGNRSNWVLSQWIKRARTGIADYIASVNVAGSPYTSMRFNTGDTFSFLNRNAADTDFDWSQTSNGLYRDPGAWMHVVTQLKNNIAHTYINGVEVSYASNTNKGLNGVSAWNHTYTHVFGDDSRPGINPFQGYMSEIHFVDGTALEPTAFGEFNADGVWVPIEVNLTQAEYGQNGFYLDFSGDGAGTISDATIGLDKSGNGNNFTPTGFELTDTTSTSYDWMADSPTDNFSTVSPLNINVQNVLSEANLRLDLNSSHAYKPVSTIAIPESGRFYFEGTVQGGNSQASPARHHYFGLNVGFPPGSSSAQLIGWVSQGSTQIYTGNGTSSGASGSGFVNGDVVQCAVDANTGQVWMGRNNTWFRTAANPDGDPAGGTNESATMVAGTQYHSYTTLGLDSGVTGGWFVNYGQRPFAHTPPAGFEPLSTAGLPNVAITNPSEHFQTILGPGPGTGGTTSLAAPAYKTTNTTDGAVAQSAYDGEPATNQLDDDEHPLFQWANNVTIGGFSDWYVPSEYELLQLYWSFKPGTDANSGGWGANPHAVPPTPNYSPGSPAQTTVAAFQLGGAEQIYEPDYVLTATERNLSQKLGIYFRDGRYYDQNKTSVQFRCRLVRKQPVTGSEPAIGAAFGGGFFAGLMDYKATPDGTATHALIVSPRNGGSYGVASGILDNAQRVFPNGLWWIKDRANNNQHQLVDSVRGGNEALNCPNLNVQNYAAPAGNSVAWCWNLLADQSNGFHIGTYTGNGSADRVVAHGCNFTPEMVILKCREGNRNFLVYHTGMDANRNVILSDTNSQFQPSHGRIDTVDATNLNLVRGGNGSTDINANGTNYVYYAWRSVPGFSAFGSYRGNGNSDGPFIYTGGFRPAFIMIKSYSDAGEWQIVDTARSTFNPTQNTQTLEPSDPGGEGNFTSRYWNGDILSNGWKYRGTQQYNASGRDYIYIAFAEHPMGGGNVSPAPAR